MGGRDDSTLSVISWLNTVPAQADTASGVDDLIRSTISAIATGFGQFAYWPGSASSQGASLASTGVMKLGEHRLSRAATRLTSYGDGYLSVSTIRNAVVHVGSTRTELVAHPAAYTWYNIAGTPSTGTLMALLQASSFSTTNNSLMNTTFPIAYTSANSVIVQATSSRSDIMYSISAVNASGFSSKTSQLGGVGSVVTIYWRALGMVTT